MHYPDNLQTDRLTTRFLSEADLAPLEEFLSDPEANKFLFNPVDPTTPLNAADWLAFAQRRYQNGRLGLQALISKDTGEFIGQCGLLVQDVNGIAEIEVGYHLLRRHWGKGYATEAARMFMAHGFNNNFADSIISIIHPQNTNSKKVAARNGLTLYDTNVDFRGSGYDIFRITRTEWERPK